jgi:hypothetical protein
METIFIDELIETLNSKIKVLEELNNLKDSRILQLEENVSSTEEILKRALLLINQYQAIVEKIPITSTSYEDFFTENVTNEAK